MKTILEFLDRIRTEKDNYFESEINSYESKAKENNWDEKTLVYRNQEDFFIYLSEDKKSLSTSWGEFDLRKNFSYLIYFCYYHEVIKYANGGLKFFGFYNSNYDKVDSIEIDNFKITKCSDGINFEELKRPTFSYYLEHRYGNHHNSLRCYARSPSSCQKALDSIWELENFYQDWFERFIYSPMSVPTKE